MSGFLHDSSAILTHFERKSLIMADRTVETLARWLHAHPGGMWISRDRSGEEARGAPEARQVMD
jgi:hypothetical protein